ncbi:transcriptional regulator [Solibacillus sp. MA9]|uniref:Transcriptional regulator n=1 Tax=Solibacillus palustris TaxID=2908203 RepID=A0ABS9UCL0_9BACL|nr:transcriptional regulator [Solibacillus sp. MA9]MCH7322077.1 transcriptional regulator [Solibacillus sp. MA9]
MNINIGDPQKYEASIQYNGIILLASYLQRLYVYETIQVKINNATDEKLKKVKGMFEHSEMMVKIFEETKSLMDGQRDKLKSFAGEVSLLMQDYIKDEPDFNERLAIVGSTLYGEQMMNFGIIKLGHIFKQNVGKDFPARAKFYEDRTKAVDLMVHLVAQGDTIEEGMQDLIDKWYVGIAAQKGGILTDIRKINEMLDFKLNQ